MLKLPQEYEDTKLGRTDLTLNEMFNRGFNSAIRQTKLLNKLNNMKEILNTKIERPHFILLIVQSILISIALIILISYGK